MIKKAWHLCLLFFLICSYGTSDKVQSSPIRSLKERTEIISALNMKRVNTLFLPAMRKAGIDCWIIMSREFNKYFVPRQDKIILIQ